MWGQTNSEIIYQYHYIFDFTSSFFDFEIAMGPSLPFLIEETIVDLIKFRYSEKATKFEKIFHLKVDVTE